MILVAPDGKPTEVTFAELERRRDRIDSTSVEHWLDKIEAHDWMLTPEAPVSESQKQRFIYRLRHPDMTPPESFGAQVARRSHQDQRWLLTGLWPWGTIPLLGGTAKAGKSTLVADLVATVTRADDALPFLGRFPLADDISEWSDGRTWLVNAENPTGAFLGELTRAGCRPTDDGSSDDHLLVVDHLEEHGGAETLDLTDPSVYDEWSARLTFGRYDAEVEDPPMLVVVDGLTAILHAAGKGPESYGLWLAQFRKLMREVGVANALVTVHNTMSGGHALGGVESQAGSDGLWTYSASNPDDPNSPRYFTVVPRMGGKAVPRSRVTRDPDTGRLLLGDPQRPGERRSRRTGNDTPPSGVNGAQGGAQAAQGRARTRTLDDLVHVVCERVSERPGIDGKALTEAVGGDRQAALGARREALARGLLREEPCATGKCECEKPHKHRRHYQLAGSTP